MICAENVLSGRPSLIPCLTPRTRLMACLLALVCVVLLNSIASSVLALGLSLTLLLLARPNMRVARKRMACVNIFIAFLWLTLPWSVPGESLIHAGPLVVTRQGLDLALLVTLKANAMVAFFLALLASLPVSSLGAALESLRCPPKLVFLMLVTYRYVFVLQDEWHSLRTSAMLRGFEPGSNWPTWKTYAMMLGMLFVRAHDRSRRVWEAMLLRGFNGHFPVSGQQRSGSGDVLFVAGLIICLALLLVHDTFPGIFHVV